MGRWFGEPTYWGELWLPERRKLLERTEGGVISLRNKQAIDMPRNIAFVRGHAGPVIWDGSELGISIAYARRAPFTLPADCLIDAVGFDTWSLLEVVMAGGVKGVPRPGARARSSAGSGNMGAERFVPGVPRTITTK